jgi:hypothetical protein
MRGITAINPFDAFSRGLRRQKQLNAMLEAAAVKTTPKITAETTPVETVDMLIQAVRLLTRYTDNISDFDVMFVDCTNNIGALTKAVHVHSFMQAQDGTIRT